MSRGPKSDAEIAKELERAVRNDVASGWVKTGLAVLTKIEAKVAEGADIPISYLSFARAFSEWHSDYLAVTDGQKPSGDEQEREKPKRPMPPAKPVSPPAPKTPPAPPAKAPAPLPKNPTK